jgi:hypothetical protein
MERVSMLNTFVIAVVALEVHQLLRLFVPVC